MFGYSVGKFRPVAFLLSALLLSSCGGGLSQVPSFGGGGAPDVRENDGAQGVELILDPIGVWEEKGAAAAEQATVDDISFVVRAREGGVLERTWVRAGLFWHSKVDKIYLPLVVLGDGVSIRRVRIVTATRVDSLRQSKKLNFKPGDNFLDDRKKTSAVFEMKPGLLAAIVRDGDARILISTPRGVLKVALNVSDDLSDAGLRRNAQYLFTKFARRRDELMGL